MAPIKKAIDSGRLGRLILGNFAVGWFREQSYYDNGWHGTWDMDGGGSLMNQAIHTIDLMRWLMGEVASVRSVMGIYAHDIETEDMTASVITFKNGAAAAICQQQHAPTPEYQRTYKFTAQAAQSKLTPMFSAHGNCATVLMKKQRKKKCCVFGAGNGGAPAALILRSS